MQPRQAPRTSRRPRHRVPGGADRDGWRPVTCPPDGGRGEHLLEGSRIGAHGSGASAGQYSGGCRAFDCETRGPEQRANEGPLRAVAMEAAKELEVMSGNRRLPMTSARWVVSPGRDSSFDSYETALQHLAGPSLPATGEVYWNDAFVDLRLDYAIDSARQTACRFASMGFARRPASCRHGRRTSRKTTARDSSRSLVRRAA